jgi:uncharacterized protein (TIGR03437 family)
MTGISKAFLLAATIGSAWGQVSTNQSLSGKYVFREVLLTTDGSTAPNVTNTLSGEGTIAFDGNGNYSVSGQQLVGTGTAIALSVTGTYSVSPGGFATLANPLKSGVTMNARIANGVLVGASTEAGPSVYDLFLAIPAWTVPASNVSVLGAYWISSLEFPGGGLTNIRNTNFKLTSTGAGTFAEIAVTGQAANLDNILTTQTLGPISYSINTDGSGAIVFPLTSGLSANQQLISGTENIFLSPDGAFFIGGSLAAGGHGLIVGVRNWGAVAATNASWSGFFWAAGMRFDTAPARLTSVVGGAYADATGNSTWARRTRQSDGLLDASPLITYNLTSDGSGVYASATGHVDVCGNKTAFASSGVDITSSTSYELYFGGLLLPQAGPGVFLNPQGVLNGASFSPPGYPISPGGVMTLFGTGFPSTAATAQAPPFPTTLGTVQVTVNNTPAPISAIVPFGVTGSTASIVVTVGATKSNMVVVPLSPTGPGIFSFPANGIGSAAALHADYSLVSAASPATQGEVISMYLTGLGATTPSVPDGTAAPGKAPFALVNEPTTIYVGGVQVPASQIYYAGLAPTLAGLYQVNFKIPVVPAGNIGVAIGTNEGFTDMVYLPIQ